MSQKVMTIEQIDQHIKDTPLRSAPVKISKDTVKQAAFNICAVYATARPIIIFVKGLLFFKPKWQTIINQFVAALDASCEIK